MRRNYPLVYYVSTFEKNGSQYLVEDYELKNIEENFLHKLFKVHPNDTNNPNNEMVGCYKINKEQANALQAYVNFVFDFKKYNYMLEVRGDYSLSDLYKS